MSLFLVFKLQPVARKLKLLGEGETVAVVAGKSWKVFTNFKKR